MTQGSQAKYTSKEKRAWATVNKLDHGGEKSGSGRKKKTENQKGLSTILGVVVLAAVVATGIVAALNSNKQSPALSNNAAPFTDTSSARATAIAIYPATNTASVSSPASAASANLKSKASKSFTPKAAQPASVPVSVFTAISPSNFPLCTANDLTGIASWQGTGSGTLSGTLLITNSSKRNCSLSHDGYLQILSGTQVLPVVQSQNASAVQYTDLSAGESITLKFIWSNWCGAEDRGGKYARLILPSDGGYIKVPLIDRSGRPQTDTPLCETSSGLSTVSIWH